LHPDRKFDATRWPAACHGRQTDHYRNIGAFGEGYLAVGSPVEVDGEPIITIEDPRQVTTVQDPLRPWRSLAGFKLFHDPAQRMDFAILWLPGKKWVARRARKARMLTVIGGLHGTPTPAAVTFTASDFDMLPVGAPGPDGKPLWADAQPDGVLQPALLGDGYVGITSEEYDLLDVPMIRAGNRDGVGEFELHTDLLDRITHTVLQQMVIATMQAFKQRALKPSVDAGEDGGLPDEDENGNPIDYNEIFEADPGALWRLPLGAEIWESGQVDLTGILSAAKDYILQLAACTQTPFPMFSPDSANQSANGASLYREGLTFKVEDRCRIAGAAWAQAFAIAFKLKHDAERGNAADVIIDWAPADRYSILEMAQADAQSSLPLAQKAARIYGMSPAEVQITLAQASQQAFLDAAMAAQRPPASGIPNVPAGA
jgi:hypothetical protein